MRNIVCAGRERAWRSAKQEHKRFRALLKALAYGAIALSAAAMLFALLYAAYENLAAWADLSSKEQMCFAAIVDLLICGTLCLFTCDDVEGTFFTRIIDTLIVCFAVWMGVLFLALPFADGDGFASAIIASWVIIVVAPIAFALAAYDAHLERKAHQEEKEEG
jgi:hypothetical protein